MTFQAYLDTIKIKTGKTPDDFRKLAAKKGLTKYSDVVAWLKSDFGLGHGHANAMAQLLVNADKFKAAPSDALARLFEGGKSKWRKGYCVRDRAARGSPSCDRGSTACDSRAAASDAEAHQEELQVLTPAAASERSKPASIVANDRKH